MTFALGALLFAVTTLSVFVVFLLLQYKAALRAHRDSDDRLRALDGAPAMLWTARPDTTLDYLNETTSRFTGLPMDRLKDKGWLDVVHPEDVARAVGTYTPAFETRLPFTFEYRVRRGDGAWRWLMAIGLPRFGVDGTYKGYVGVDIDITERKNAEHRMLESQAALEESNRQIQRLAGRLIEAQDVERARLARDLHDDVSQQLAGLSIAMSGLRHRMDELELTDEIRDDLRSLHERTTTLGWNVRHLSHDLHPTVLRHSGLLPALKTYCSEVERLHGANTTCTAVGDFATLPADAALCLYRIAQEAVRNVIAHAGASRVEIRLHRNGGDTELTITDDGRGFDMAGSLERGKGLGLVSMAERARLARGTVAFTTEPGRGTCVQVRIPA